MTRLCLLGWCFAWFFLVTCLRVVLQISLCANVACPTKILREDCYFLGRQINYLIYEYFRVIGAIDSVEHYEDFFAVVLRDDDSQEFDSKWDGVLLSMTQIPHDDILEGSYKFRIREFEKLKTVIEL